MYSASDWSCLYKTGPGRASVTLPQEPIAQADLASTAFQGMFYASGSGSATNVRITSNATGDVFTVVPYTNVATNTLSGVTSDTITITAVNSPLDGFMKATVTRNGSGSGKLICLANRGGGIDGQLFACSGTDPITNTLHYGLIGTFKRAAGSLDPTFGGSGVIHTQVSGGASPSSTSNGVAIDSKGRIVVAGDATDASGNGGMLLPQNEFTASALFEF